MSDEAKHEKALASAKEVGDSRQQEFEQQLELATESAEERVVQAEQRQAQAMAATADAKREVATAEDKVRELEDHVWRLEQGRGGHSAAEGTIQDAAQLASENFSLRQRLAQVEAEKAQVLEATPEQQADAIAQQLGMAMKLRQGTGNDDDEQRAAEIQRLKGALQSAEEALADVRARVAEDEATHSAERSESKLQISDLQTAVRRHETARAQAERGAAATIP